MGPGKNVKASSYTPAQVAAPITGPPSNRDAPTFTLTKVGVWLLIVLVAATIRELSTVTLLIPKPAEHWMPVADPPPFVLIREFSTVRA